MYDINHGFCTLRSHVVESAANVRDININYYTLRKKSCFRIFKYAQLINFLCPSKPGCGLYNIVFPTSVNQLTYS